jgi:hypothetical protein
VVFVSTCAELQGGEIIWRDAEQKVETLMHITGIHFGLSRVRRVTVNTDSVKSK